MSINFRSNPGIMRSAIVYMVGQMEHMNLPVTTADVAAFCDCSKITARKHLKVLVQVGRLQRVSATYKKVATKDTWSLSAKARNELEVWAAFKHSYDVLMAQKVGINGY